MKSFDNHFHIMKSILKYLLFKMSPLVIITDAMKWKFNAAVYTKLITQYLSHTQKGNSDVWNSLIILLNL